MSPPDDGGPRYAVYHQVWFWLVDTCAGGSWSVNVDDAVWFSSPQEALDALRAAEISWTSPAICRVR